MKGFQNLLDLFNRNKIQEKKLVKYQTLKKELENLSVDEFDMRYMRNKGALYRKEFIQKSFVVALILSFLAFCFTILKDLSTAFLNYLNGSVSKDVSDITMYVIVTVIGILFLLLLFCLVIFITIFHDIKKIKDELYLMEKIKKDRMEN